MSSTQKPKIGELMVKEGLLTQDQLQETLLVQKNQKAYMPLGDICVDMKYLTKADLNRILEKYKKRIQLGDLLLKLQLITEDQLQEALKQQKVEKKKLGEILVRMGFITEASLVDTLSIQFGVPKIATDFNLIDEKLLAKINKEFLFQNEIIPAFKEDNILTVIMSNPLDDDLIRNLNQIFRCTIEPAIASASDIRKTLENHYQREAQKNKGVLQKPAIQGVKKGLVIDDEDSSLENTDNVISIFNYLVSNAIKEEASDIHIEPKEKNIRVRYRIDGILQHKTDLPISMAPKLVSRIKVLSGIDITEKRRHQDGRIAAKVLDQEVDLRISSYVSIYGENVVIRLLPRQSKLIDLELLGFSPANRVRFQQILDQPSGVALITGPTGSGKTTALYAALSYLNNGKNSIITVEDPVEYTMEGITQGQLDPNLGLTYEDFLKSMMRQDPDIIMLGEIRDTTAANAAIQMALTGHKVLSTFHSDDTTGTLLRLLDMGIEPFLVSSAVNVVVTQRLVRVLCKYCRKLHVPDQRMLDSFHIRDIDLKKLTFYQPVGCSYCGGKGFKGRTALHELLVINDAMRDAIMKRKTSTDMRSVARYNADLISMREDGFYKAVQGITSLEEVLRLVYYSEGEEATSRSAAEIVALSEGKKINVPQQVESSLTPQRFPTPEPENFIPLSDPLSTPVFQAIPQEIESMVTPVIPQEISVPEPGDLRSLSGPLSAFPVSEGEVYRIRFEATAVDSETEQITDLFKQIQKIVQEMGKTLDADHLEDFIDSVVYSVKRLEISLKAEFVELCLQVREGKVKILLETLIPQKPSSSTFYKSKETGLRLINFLLPSAGQKGPLASESPSFNRAGSSRNRTPLIELMKQKEIDQYQQRTDGEESEDAQAPIASRTSQLHDASYAKSVGLYKKHVEELELNLKAT